MLRRILTLFHRARFESDLDAELRDHLRKYRDVRASFGLAWADTAGRNFRYGLRLLCKNPVFSLTVIVTLGAVHRRR